MSRLDMDKRTAESLVKRYGPERAEIIAANRAESAMTDEAEEHWQNIAVAVRLMRTE